LAVASGSCGEQSPASITQTSSEVDHD
jgi:hypothetical protein